MSAEIGAHLQKWKPRVCKSGSGAKPVTRAKSSLKSFARFFVLDEPGAYALEIMKNSRVFASLA